MFWGVRVSFGRPRTIEVIVGVFLRLLLGLWLEQHRRVPPSCCLPFVWVTPPYYVLESRRLQA